MLSRLNQRYDAAAYRPGGVGEKAYRRSSFQLPTMLPATMRRVHAGMLARILACEANAVETEMWSDRISFAGGVMATADFNRTRFGSGPLHCASKMEADAPLELHHRAAVPDERRLWGKRQSSILAG